MSSSSKAAKFSLLTPVAVCFLALTSLSHESDPRSTKVNSTSITAFKDAAKDCGLELVLLPDVDLSHLIVGYDFMSLRLQNVKIRNLSDFRITVVTELDGKEKNEQTSTFLVNVNIPNVSSTSDYSVSGLMLGLLPIRGNGILFASFHNVSCVLRLIISNVSVDTRVSLHPKQTVIEVEALEYESGNLVVGGNSTTDSVTDVKSRSWEKGFESTLFWKVATIVGDKLREPVIECLMKGL